MNPLNQYLPNKNNNPLSVLRRLQENPQAVLNQFMQNPQFAEFYRKNQNKTPEQVAQEYGININQINQLISGITAKK